MNGRQISFCLQAANCLIRRCNTSTSDNQNSNITKKHNLDTTQNVDEPSLKKVKILKYKDSYIEYGFTYLNENGKDVPQCVICGITLANTSLKPNKLIRHMETSHAQYKNNTRDFFLRKFEELKKNKKMINTYTENILTKNEINEMCIIIEEHLGRLREKMSKYFDPTKDIRKNCNWVINPFVQSDQNILSLTNEEKLIELSANVGLHEIFRSNKNIGQFWIKVQNEYPSLAEEALKLLIPFSTTYLCENGFSTLITIKNKTRNRLEISSAMRISLTKSIKPRIDEIISHQQQQPSH
ncbi:hypothetical protein QTP88_019657 [Uroleucon formosanum]